MLTLSEKECIQRIKKRECFHAEVNNGSYIIKIDEYTPLVCAAIHNGHQLRSELANSFLLSKQERFYEEDPYTDELISSFPIQLIGNDSRFEYDLNRAKTLSTYFKTAWNKQVWQKPLTQKQRAISHAKHESFYNVLEAIVSVIEKQFGNAIIFDIHSYNYKRIEMDTPTFNIGSGQIDVERWGKVIGQFERQLNKIALPNIDLRAATDEVFHGRGYLISHINAHFDNTLVLPVEVKKVFMDETSGEVYPLVLEDLKAGFKDAISETAAFFMRRYTKKTRTQKADILSSNISPEVIELDKKLFSLCKSVETLNFINPINLAAQKSRFLKKNSYIAPNFNYKQLNLNPYKFRENLYKLPVDDIYDAGISQLYRHVIDNLASKIDLLTSIGTDDFIYNSLKYYGEPNQIDIANARFILHLNEEEFVEPDMTLNADDAIEYFKHQAQKWGLKCKIEKSAKIVAKAMVNNEKALLLINKEAEFTEKELHAFAYHELGIHMLTTINAKKHPLKVFSLGLPGNTHTQEGIALYSEYCSGNLTIKRLKTIALRVVAVQYMLEHGDFVKTYHALMNEFSLDKEFAFTLTTRVYRGGGFTKDYLYLTGFRDVLNVAKERSIDNLLVGKTGLLDFDVVSEMVERGMLQKPVSLFDTSYSVSNDKVLDFIVNSIK
ncbi:flavohemoglobin expression-modulating QEGLA motif protein [Psychrobium sp. 1_MG-2023]|uniref:flavohemoglobin expression-modulating QEGLA motif protein n=1 Tax=Psychrobium sp. 1_MG-2023 TaxID=3062624 RepID=UPI000C335781|nr:flavohemoglobin expression-modulating QEGLA motif protein [Psychrobium sp. 1_MG-2023]MDP2561388.1 flavohemoglobin expression-modulating QEGLA motif protein [Psychrobium sp. 1_MG-2023]PKF54868.1 flavohemoglobin expression-modulating QEGLA motif protein [Alteromonadales bacterium alter-6D02]